MKIIRSESQDGMNTPDIAMIPLFVSWGIRRCNLKGCKRNPTTIVANTQAPAFGMCEDHFQEASNTVGDYNLELEFDS